MSTHRIQSPFLKTGPETKTMMMGMMIALIITAVHFSWRFDPWFIRNFSLYVLFGLGLEVLYYFLKDNRFQKPKLSTAVTTSLLVLSVPAQMSWMAFLSGIFVAVFFGKFIVDKRALRINPMILGRLFMMIVFVESIQDWGLPNQSFDTITSATPLGLYFSEGGVYDLLKLFCGSIKGEWEGYVTMIPGSPGEVMPLLSLIFGICLYIRGIIDWRPGVFYILSFLIACQLLGMPLMFHLLAGSTIFTAVYIITDPRSTPASKSGRIMAGIIAGVLNALIRNHGFFPEGVVFAVLFVNLISPILDRLAFWGQAVLISRRK